jgi:hypothetical protein
MPGRGGATRPYALAPVRNNWSLGASDWTPRACDDGRLACKDGNTDLTWLELAAADYIVRLFSTDRKPHAAI